MFHSEMSSVVQVQNKELHLPNLVPNRQKLNEYGN